MWNVVVNCYKNKCTMSRRKRSVPATQSITSFFSKRIRLDEGKTVFVRITQLALYRLGHYPNSLTCTVTVSQLADKSVDTASQSTIPITSAESPNNSSDEMTGDSLKDSATTLTASGISTNGGIAIGFPILPSSYGKGLATCSDAELFKLKLLLSIDL